MFKELINPGSDYGVFDTERLPIEMKSTGGIMYIPNGKPRVQISGNVPDEYRDTWVQHEIACNTGKNAQLAHWCRQVSEAEIELLVPQDQLTGYVRHRVAMLQAAVQVNQATLDHFDYLQYFSENPDKKEALELSIAKLESSLGFFNERFGDILK